MIKIIYTENFKGFLDNFDAEKQELIKKILTEYCDHQILLPRPKASSFRKDIKKVAIHESNIVVFYLELDDTWLLLTGVEMFDRAA